MVKKTPSHDGFNFNFYKRFWNLLKNDILYWFQSFLRDKLSNIINNSYITLIPKQKGNIGFRYYRLISLMILKILDNQVIKAMNGIVSSPRYAFIASKYILSSIIIINKDIDTIKSKGIQWLILKIDFYKVFDSISLYFLNKVMEYISFEDCWCRWIQVYISTSRFSILINGLLSP